MDQIQKAFIEQNIAKSLAPLFSSKLLMHPVLFLVLSVLLLTLSSSSSSPPPSSEIYYRYANCGTYSYACGAKRLEINYPFRVDGRPDYCGHPGYYIGCSRDKTSMTMSIGGRGYQVIRVDYLNDLVTVVDPQLLGQPCPRPYENTSIDFALYDCSDRDRNVTVYANCSASSPALPLQADVSEIRCARAADGRRWYYQLGNEGVDAKLMGRCNSTVMVPMNQTTADELARGSTTFSGAVKEGFSVSWTAGKGWCSDCSSSGGRCGYNSSHSFTGRACYCQNGPAIEAAMACLKGKTKRKKKTPLVLGALAAAGVLLLLCLVIFFVYRQKKRKLSPSSKSLFQTPSSKHSFKDPEMSSGHLQTHLFSYAELHEATNCFHASNELGDGGFGTVYKGKLKDGRTVAVKRLYENNCRRLEQFMNEIEILSRLRHKNLVGLYGCTSPRSQGLLLVYEFVPNGTLADHLHGSRAGEGILTWPVRLGIAIETADALAYLHSVEPPIVHRDVKTCNILLDGSFHVKVADFGLSRLFPTDATHVSTAPQGTPGYLDPEYHQCYQLTDKSDVYSFGVVLVELISSKPAIDMTRHRSEINLANLAMTKIQNGELEQLVDDGLGYLSDQVARRMITMVAEVAFRCLQSDGDMRPPIKEVLEALKAIQGEGPKVDSEAGENGGGIRAEAALLKNEAPFSPDTVINNWASRSTTPHTRNISEDARAGKERGRHFKDDPSEPQQPKSS